MPWEVKFDDLFEPEFDQLAESVQDEILARAQVLGQFGPQLGRPHVDTLNASKHANMKELRFNCDDGKWRIAFAFDPKRTAVLLVAGDKVGADQQRFYEQLISTADARFDAHLAKLKQEQAKLKPGKAKQGKGKQGKGKQGRR
jgi:hypothetical protein